MYLYSPATLALSAAASRWQYRNASRRTLGSMHAPPCHHLSAALQWWACVTCCTCVCIADGGLLQHSNMGSSTLNLASGTSSGVSGEPARITRLKNVSAQRPAPSAQLAGMPS